MLQHFYRTFSGNTTRYFSTNIEANIIRIIQDKIKPGLSIDGGDIQFIKYNGKTVFVKLQGSCKDCSLSAQTLEDFVLKTLVFYFPGDVEKISAIDHNITEPNVVKFSGNPIKKEDLEKNYKIFSLYHGKDIIDQEKKIKFLSSRKLAPSEKDLFIKCQDCLCSRRLEDIRSVLEDDRLASDPTCPGIDNKQPSSMTARVVLCPVCAIDVYL